MPRYCLALTQTHFPALADEAIFTCPKSFVSTCFEISDSFVMFECICCCLLVAQYFRCIKTLCFHTARCSYCCPNCSAFTLLTARCSKCNKKAKKNMSLQNIHACSISVFSKQKSDMFIGGTGMLIVPPCPINGLTTVVSRTIRIPWITSNCQAPPLNSSRFAFQSRVSISLGTPRTQPLNSSRFASQSRVSISLGTPQTQPLNSRQRALQTHSTMAAATTQYRELNDAPDFDSIASADGYVSVSGFGSLLSERSARSTFPNLQNFRVAVLRGFRRVFAHTAPIFFERGIARMETKEISSLSVEPCPGEFIIVTVFEIHKSEVPAFIERENEFRFLVVVPEDIYGTPFSHPSVVCSRYSDEEYHLVRCKGNEEMFFQRYGRYNIDKIWRDDILPCRVYLRHCVLAAKNLGETAYNNFLDHTFLGDRKTCIREYLSSQALGIMEEEPPPALKERYGG